MSKEIRIERFDVNNIIKIARIVHRLDTNHSTAIWRNYFIQRVHTIPICWQCDELRRRFFYVVLTHRWSQTACLQQFQSSAFQVLVKLICTCFRWNGREHRQSKKRLQTPLTNARVCICTHCFGTTRRWCSSGFLFLFLFFVECTISTSTLCKNIEFKRIRLTFHFNNVICCMLYAVVICCRCYLCFRVYICFYSIIRNVKTAIVTSPFVAFASLSGLQELNNIYLFSPSCCFFSKKLLVCVRI